MSGYAFVVEDLSYNFSTADLRGLESRETVPVVLDWAVGNLTCREAKENNNVSAFACRASKSDCVDSSNGSGYRCICMDILTFFVVAKVYKILIFIDIYF